MRTTKSIIIFSLFVFSFNLFSLINALPLAPALYVFGDSLLDSGNNNLIPTIAKVNYWPYGADFPKGATGRFTNGRTVADFLADYLGLPYSPPYFSLEGPRSLTGINYASGGCGILPETGRNLGKCVNFEEQINLFQKTIEWHLPKRISDPTQLSEHLSKSIYIISIGSNDYINNYLDTKLFVTSKRYQPEPYAQLLIDNLSQLLERLYKLGARKILMIEIGPLGCTPLYTGSYPHTGDCVQQINQMVGYFNERLPAMLKNLTSTLPGSMFVLGHANSLAVDAIKNPSKYGLTDVGSACCLRVVNATCIPLSNPCLNARQHFFWDGCHPTESAYSVIASRFFSDKSVCTPVNIQELIKL